MTFTIHSSLNHNRQTPHSATTPYNTLAERLLYAQIAVAIIFQKIVLSFGSETQVFIGIPIMLAITALGLITKVYQLRPFHTVIYLLMVTALILTQLLGQSYAFSIPSLLLLIILHLPYAFGPRPGFARPGAELVFFQKISLLVAALGLIQFAAQFVIGSKYAFPVDNFLPTTLLPHGYNNVPHGYNSLNPLHPGSDIYKSNGVFFREPAAFCQLIAISVIIEMTYFRNWKRLALFLAAIAVTFSGTGLIILFVLTPFYLLQKRHFLVLFIGAILVLTAGFWTPLVGLEATYTRTSEFFNPHASGFARFLGALPLLDKFIWPDLTTTLFGRGAGSVIKSITDLDHAAHNPTWVKIIFEFGLVGFYTYAIFFACILLTPRRSGYLKAALAIQFVLLGEYVLSPTVHGILLGLLIRSSADPDLQANTEEPTTAFTSTTPSNRRQSPNGNSDPPVELTRQI
jgi:hypothetical protein